MALLNPEPGKEHLNAQKDVVLQELRTFLNGATHSAKVRNVDVARSAIYLLKTLPAARDAVLEHMYNLFDETVNSYVLKYELEDRLVDSLADDDVVEEIHGVLSQFISNGPDYWASIISSWALDLLGYLSSKYADKCVAQHASNLPKVLQFWMACKPTRVLIEMTTQCLSTVIGSNPDMCIDALLETSVQHSPHFDWVVAHIGSCFPTTVVTRVLACGLKAFCLPQDAVDDSSGSGKHVSKIASVVGILGHLAAHHSDDIRKALLSLFHESFSDNPTKEQLATVPFLLHLASMSEMLSHVITSEFVTVVTPELLQKLSLQVNQWKSSQIPGTGGLIQLILHLLLKSNEGSKVIKCLLKIVTTMDSSNPINKTIQDAAGWILDSILLEIQHRVHADCSDIPILQSFKIHISDFSSCLKENSGCTANWILNILKFVCIHGGDKTSIDILGHLLCTISEVTYIKQLLAHVELTHPQVLYITVSNQMAELKCSRIKEPVQLIKNFINLIKLEEGSKQIIEAIQPSMEILAGQVMSVDCEYADVVIELLSLTVVPESMNMSSLLRVSFSVVGYFFKLLSKQDIDRKLIMLQICQNLLTNLCQQTATQNMILRTLLETALDDNNTLFASKCFPNLKDKKSTWECSLLAENRQYSTSITLPQNHSSVFHTGIIGYGLRPTSKLNAASRNETVLNRQVLLNTIQACCIPSWRFPLDKVSNRVTGPDMKTVALLLVELVSPDVMFNGLPWPDEDFLKVTIERDLHIKRKFDEHPVLWDLLFLIASAHPSLCYCSVLLRAIMAVLITHWGSCQEKKTSNSPKQLEITQRLIDVMAIGQILPPPLAYIGEILQSITPFEMFCLLSDIWQYMKDNVPSPALFTLTKNGRMWRDFSQNVSEMKSESKIKLICEKKYTDRLRFIMQANIEKFGSIYPKFFPSE
ncbi:integrator complex subunit 5-like [Centruroides sculpturatus]|uniref:integrator complex subunit 5-like n=1 Tax=Centruroides sculpturatus TaxID=218467 RepID=UPI000C6E89A3|nr:integrator complex subunit 5-like [Centruroides sculpturatus]